VALIVDDATFQTAAGIERLPVDASGDPAESARAGAVRPGTWIVPIAVGLLVRILYWVVVTPNWTPRSDARQYVDLARSLAAGDGFAARYPGTSLHPTAFRPPLYPAILAVPTKLFGPAALWPGRLLAVIIGLGVIALTVTYARRIAGDRAGLVAGLAVALMPSLIANDTITTTESLGLVLVLAVLLALLDSRAVLAGAMVGLLLLTRPNAYLVLLVVVIALWRSVGWRRAGVAVGVCVCVVSPWVARNAVVVGTPKLVTSDGFTLAAIYGPPAVDTGGFVDPTVDDWYQDAGIHALAADEAAWSDALTRVAADGIRAHPEEVLRRAVGGAASFAEVPGHRAWAAEIVDGRDTRFRNATLFLFPLFVAAGLAGTAIRARDRRTWPGIAIVGGFVALSLVTVSVPRLRGPFDLLMCIGIGYLAARLQERRQSMNDGFATGGRQGTATVPSSVDRNGQMEASGPAGVSVGPVAQVRGSAAETA